MRPRRADKQLHVLLRETRIERSLTQRDVCAKTGLGVWTLSRIENGHEVPSMKTTSKLADAYKLDRAQVQRLRLHAEAKHKSKSRAKPKPRAKPRSRAKPPRKDRMEPGVQPELPGRSLVILLPKLFCDTPPGGQTEMYEEALGG